MLLLAFLRISPLTSRPDMLTSKRNSRFSQDAGRPGCQHIMCPFAAKQKVSSLQSHSLLKHLFSIRTAKTTRALSLVHSPQTATPLGKALGARNYDAMATQAAMFAGFAFEQITEPVPAATPFLLEAGRTGVTGEAGEVFKRRSEKGRPNVLG